jgi:hypothetical protein
MILSQEAFWFSHREEIWDIKNGKFLWTREKRVWDWDNCTFGLVRTRKNELRIIVRSEFEIPSSYMGKKPVTLRYMLGFDVKQVSEPEFGPYTARKYKPKKKEGPKERWGFQLDDNYWIWQWADKEDDLRTSPVYQLFRRIRDEISSPSLTSHNIFEVDVECEEGRIIPVVYQPSVDGLKNFVREIHSAELSSRDGAYQEIEVSIIFANEQLRAHAIFNKVYELYRWLAYGRIQDIETIKIILPREDDENKFVFESIYSDDEQLNVDDKHGDQPIAPERRIKYYFVNDSRPIVFVNTSNHAMAEHDTNERIWKWEYIPGIENAPIKHGCKTRDDLDREFKPFWRFW